jgi:AGZA family xanthine/uracil permease-like MFS transporter
MENQKVKIKEKKSFSVENYFKFEERKATWKKELLGGATAFLALIYMINVESGYLINASGNYEGGRPLIFGAYLITCLTLGIGSIVMGLSTKTPTMATPAMGLNAMFVFNVASKSTDPNIAGTTAMLATMISSVLLVIICYTKLLTWILNAIPKSLSIGITVAFGFYIAYVGFNSMGWFSQSAGGLPVASHDGIKQNYPGVILGMAVVLLILLFHFKKINGGVAIAMAAGLIISVILANTLTHSDVISKSFGLSKWVGWKYDVNDFDISKNFTETLKNGISSKEVWASSTIYISIFMFTLIALFNISGGSYVIVMDDIATVGTPEFDLEVKKQLRATSAIGVVASVIGCSPVVNALETKAGMGQGSRTGVAAIFSGLLFLFSLALLPLFKMMPSCVTGAASVYIGFLMMTNIVNIDWKEPEFLLSVSFMIIFSITTFSIVDGIAIGFIIYSLISLFTKRAKQVSVTMWILSVVFIGYFVAAFFQ